jgi:methionyl-tRNA formyltransferase
MADGHILREYILNLPPLGIYNFHVSVLPQYRGASPVETAIACGEKVTGISLMEVVHEMYAGDVLDIEKVRIAEADFASNVYHKLSQPCVAVIEHNIANIIREKAKRTKTGCHQSNILHNGITLGIGKIVPDGSEIVSGE